jgi:hypothetical protein
VLGDSKEGGEKWHTRDGERRRRQLDSLSLIDGLSLIRGRLLKDHTKACRVGRHVFDCGSAATTVPTSGRSASCTAGPSPPPPPPTHNPLIPNSVPPPLPANDVAPSLPAPPLPPSEAGWAAPLCDLLRDRLSDYLTLSYKIC